MSGKKRFQKPGSLQPNIDDILEWSKLPEDAFDAASSQEKADFIKDRKSVSYWADAWRRLRKNKVAMVALAIIIALVIFGFVGPSLVPYTYKQQVRGSEALHPWHYTLEDQQKINDYMEEKNQTANLTPDEAVEKARAEAAAEGIAMCRDKKRNRALISAAVLPAALETVKTYCFGNEIELEIIPEKNGVTDLDYLKEHMDKSVACVYIQHPNYYGNLEDAEAIGEIVHESGAKYIMGVNPISLGVLKTPAEYGADIAVGEGQPLGLPMAFGGPYLGFMACREKMMRKLPGRIVGQTVDADGKTGYVLTLQAREQHIRREKASSNICSNQALCALAVGVYLAAMGNEGLEKAATQCMSKAHYLANQLTGAGFAVENKGDFFHEFVTVSSKDTDKVLAALEKENILGGQKLDDHRILWCCTEMNTKEDMDLLVRIVKEV